MCWQVLAGVALALLFGSAAATRCYVCGGKSLLADACIDDYEISETDMTDCSKVLGHTDGCIKSKFIDKDDKQFVTRSCAPEIGMKASNECKSTKVAEIQAFFCHCVGDYCNSSPRQHANLLLITIASSIAVIFSIYL